MKTTTNQNAKGLLMSLTFIALFFVSLIIMLVTDIDAGSFLEDKVNTAINNEINIKISQDFAGGKAKVSANANFFDFGN